MYAAGAKKSATGALPSALAAAELPVRVELTRAARAACADTAATAAVTPPSV